MLHCDDEWVGVGREEPRTEEDKDQILKVVGTGRNFAVLHKGFTKKAQRDTEIGRGGGGGYSLI